eukprot:SM003425S12980  [mRNA]  locus=s3425:77:631:+ [translate_table: standard]
MLRLPPPTKTAAAASLAWLHDGQWRETTARTPSCELRAGERETAAAAAEAHLSYGAAGVAGIAGSPPRGGLPASWDADLRLRVEALLVGRLPAPPHAADWQWVWREPPSLGSGDVFLRQLLSPGRTLVAHTPLPRCAGGLSLL